MFTRNLPVNFYPFLSNSLNRRILGERFGFLYRSSLSSSRETFHEFIYFLFYFPFILLFAFEKEMISRNLLMSLHFLTIWIVKRTRESILDLKVLFSILKKEGTILNSSCCTKICISYTRVQVMIIESY